ANLSRTIQHSYRKWGFLILFLRYTRRNAIFRKTFLIFRQFERTIALFVERVRGEQTALSGLNPCPCATSSGRGLDRIRGIMPTGRTHPVRHVAVLIESSLGYGRGLLEGIARYSREQGTWVLYFELRGLEAFPLWMRDWKGDGILVSFPSWQVTPALLAKSA